MRVRRVFISAAWWMVLALIGGGCGVGCAGGGRDGVTPEVAAGLRVWEQSAKRPAAEVFDEGEIRRMLEDNVGEDGQADGVAFGVVDQKGSRVYCAGTLGDGTGKRVDGRTLFKIGSITKVFTAILLQDMVDRGEMKLEDPVGKYLPESVRVPGRNGKPITLFDLATHTSGLPRDAAAGAGGDAEKLYAFLSRCTLAHDPGAHYEYSNLGLGLLGHAIALKAGRSYEQLVVERICAPLGMSDTRQTLTRQLRARTSAGHAYPGRVARDGEWHGPLEGCGALYSTADDMLKFVAANAGITQTPISPLLKRAHAVQTLSTGRQGRLAWMEEAGFICHGGLTGGFLADIGFDLSKKRGVVLLVNCTASRLRVLWKPYLKGKSQRPAQARASKNLDRLVGTYRYEEGAECVVRREGERLMFQWWPAGAWRSLPYVRTEGFALSDGLFFNRLWDGPTSFDVGADGRVTGMRIHLPKETLSLEKVSDNTPPRTFTRADPGTYERMVGQYRVCLLGVVPVGPALNLLVRDDERGRHLMAYVPEMGQAELYCADKPETFMCPEMDGAWLAVSQRETESGKASGVMLHHQGKSIRARRVSDVPERPGGR